jgi:hypothetical protein
MMPSKSMRGLHNILVSGMPYNTDVARWHTFKNWVNAPHRIILHSIAFSEAVHCSNFDYITRKERGTLRDPLMQSIGNVRASEAGLLRDFAMINMRYGFEATAPWASLTGLARYNWLDVDIMRAHVEISVTDPLARANYAIIQKAREVADQEVTFDYLALRVVVPICYPILSYGINVSKFYMNETHLEAELTAPANLDILRTKDVHTAHKFMAMMRVMGVNCTVTRSTDKQRFTNWAPNANGHYVPTFLATVDPDEHYDFDVEQFTMRRHNWIMPPMFNDKLKFTMDLIYQTFQLNFDGKRANVAGQRLAIQTYDVAEAETKVYGVTTAYAQITLSGIQPVRELADFRIAWDIMNTVPDTELFTGPSMTVNPMVEMLT